MIATLKHFPGHGDTDADTHLGLAVVAHDRAELDRVELVPFRLGIAGGAQAVMTSHIELPALDAAPATPATFSQAIVGRPAARRPRVRRPRLHRLDVDGGGEKARRRRAKAPCAPFSRAPTKCCTRPIRSRRSPALKDAVASGRISAERLDASVRRILRAKAFVGLDAESRGRSRESCPIASAGARTRPWPTRSPRDR